jgi:hypothetical protein
LSPSITKLRTKIDLLKLVGFSLPDDLCRRGQPERRARANEMSWRNIRAGIVPLRDGP